VSTILDETYKIAVTRFDDRIRVGGMAEIAGFDTRSIRAAAKRWKWWSTTCSRAPATRPKPASGPACAPMTPDGTPVVGRTGLRNLFINTGHGTLGWTMSCGSAQLLADLISARRPPSRPTTCRWPLQQERGGRQPQLVNA
jgi:D-amino-acid dehydrogenase